MRINIQGRKFWVAGGPEMVAKLDSEIDGPNGAIPVRFYYPTEESYKGRTDGTTKTPTIVYVHGGGWVLATLKRTIVSVVYLPKRARQSWWQLIIACLPN